MSSFPHPTIFGTDVPEFSWLPDRCTDDCGKQGLLVTPRPPDKDVQENAKPNGLMMRQEDIPQLPPQKAEAKGDFARQLLFAEMGLNFTPEQLRQYQQKGS